MMLASETIPDTFLWSLPVAVLAAFGAAVFGAWLLRSRPMTLVVAYFSTFLIALTVSGAIFTAYHCWLWYSATLRSQETLEGFVRQGYMAQPEEISASGQRLVPLTFPQRDPHRIACRIGFPPLAYDTAAVWRTAAAVSLLAAFVGAAGHRQYQDDRRRGRF